jgi:hypothetical protein
MATELAVHRSRLRVKPDAIHAGVDEYWGNIIGALRNLEFHLKKVGQRDLSRKIATLLKELYPEGYLNNSTLSSDHRLRIHQFARENDLMDFATDATIYLDP